jgi:hypothetical protein
MGDFEVKRTLFVGRRVNETSESETLSGNRPIEPDDFSLLNLDPGASDRDITLPDATLLVPGWTIMIRHSGSTNSLIIKDFDDNSIKTITAPPPPTEEKLYRFILIDNSNSAGIWQIIQLGDMETIAANRVVVLFAAADFSAPAQGNRNLTPTQVPGLAASVHGRGQFPIYKIQEQSGTDYDEVLVNRVRTASNGDISIQVSANAVFTGRLIIL